MSDAPEMRNGETWTHSDGEWTRAESLRIEPTLTAEQMEMVRGVTLIALIRAANATLPDGHPAKITRKTVATLRDLIDAADHDDAGPWGESWQSDELVAVLAASRAIADALESYLPPEIP